MSIESELKRWMSDSKNKARISGALTEKIKSGGTVGTGKGSMSLVDAIKLGEELRDTIYAYLPGYTGNSPEFENDGGIRASLDPSAVIVSAPVVLADGQIRVDIKFDKSKLHRDSLNPEKYDGVDDIIAVLVQGYHTGGDVFGEWHGREQWNLRDRKPNPFIEKAIEWFNSSHDGEAVATVVNEKYKVQ